jgi:Tfp pilus assembly protein PilX
MSKHSENYSANKAQGLRASHTERGAALSTALIVMSLLAAISMTVLAVVTHEARIAGSDLQRTQTFYAADAGLEKMTNGFSKLFAKTSNPTSAQLSNIATSYPTELINEGFSFNQTLSTDATANSGTVTIPNGPFSGLYANVTPYLLTSTAIHTNTGTQVSLQRKMNNYLVPIFQFGMFSNEDIELYPLPAMALNGRVHANGNIYASASTSLTFQAKVTTANEFITDVWRNGTPLGSDNVFMTVGGINVPITMGSMVNGPNIPGTTAGQRGYAPGSPNGTINSTWDTTSVKSAVSGVANQFGGQLITRSTGGASLRLPMELEGAPSRELIKRKMPNDPQTLSDSRFHIKAEIRILIDDESPSTTDAAGIPVGLGVRLSQFDPLPLPSGAPSTGGGRALWQINDNGTYFDTVDAAAKTCLQSGCVLQQNGGSTKQADAVRGVKGVGVNSPGGIKIPPGAGITGRVLIQIVDASGNTYDVTQQILSLGMTEGEPNAIVTLQRPLWAAFTQGSRDASGSSATNYLTYVLNSTSFGCDGEILIDSSHPVVNTTYGYLTSIQDDGSGQAQRSDLPTTNWPSPFSSATLLSNLLSDWGTGNAPSSNWVSHQDWNAIVPINIYNVQEGSISAGMTSNTVFERGITNVVEINTRNLARWMDGVYDTNLLAGTSAISSNIAKPDGYIVYVSDRRGDRVKSMVDLTGATINSSNGMVDNEDIYGPNGVLDPGEDIQGKGVLVKDTTELPDPAALSGTSGADFPSRVKRAISVASWANPNNYFRRTVRLFNGENLQVSGASGKLSSTMGITVSSENMVYIWGNYNTTGINSAPPNGTAALNVSSATYRYVGNQVPAAVIADAFSPMSKTWFDSSSAMFPDLISSRLADLNLPSVGAETSVRTAIIAGNNLSALAGTPDQGNGFESRLNGGMINFPRFVEDWFTVNRRWNYTGSFIPLYHATQMIGPWWYVPNYEIYQPPIRDWSFDDTFKDPTRLPPGTPLFQYVQPTGFKQIL